MKIKDLNGKTVKIQGRNMTLAVKSYAEGNPAIVIMDDYEIYGIASVNMQPYGSKLTKEELETKIYIKNYSENAFWIDDLFNSNLFEDTGESLSLGYVKIPLWKIKE